jgi:hypothetical protein
MRTDMIRRVAFGVGAVLLLNSMTLASAQTLAPEDPGLHIEFWKWAVTQGGLVVVTLVILWSYRKDFKSVRAENKETLSVVAGLVKESVASTTEGAAASRAVAEALDRLERRDGHDRRH